MSLIHRNETASPARLLEMLSDRFGAFEAVAYSTIKLARYVEEDELSMDVLVAESILEFADDLRWASHQCTTAANDAQEVALTALEPQSSV